MCLLFCNIVVVAQNRNTQLDTELFTEHIERYNENDIYISRNPSNYKGSPYYNTSFLEGSLFLNNQLLDNNVSLRYNAFTDEIEIKDAPVLDKNSMYALIKSEDLHVTILQDLFIFKKNKGYFLVVYDGDNVSLLKKINKKYYPPKKATTSLTKDVPAEFQNRISYSLATREGELIALPKSRNNKIGVFSENERIIKEYVKENSLDLNKEKDLKKLILYFDSLHLTKL